MAIFDEKKMEQKPIYPTKKTPSYADWALFNMGKELEESITGGGGEITVDQEVIAGSENPVAGGAVKTYVDTEVGNVNEVPDSTAADVNKILTVDANGMPNWSTPLTPQVTVDQTVIADSTNPVAGGGVKTYVDTEIAGINEVPVSTSADAGKILTVDSNGAAKWEDAANIAEQTVIDGSTEPVSGGAVKNYVDTAVGNVNEVPASTTLDEGKILTVDSNGDASWDDVANVTEQSVVAGSVEPVSGGAVKTYVDTEIGNVNEVPASSSADANKVLTVDSNGNANWQTPSSGGVTAHTYSTFGELYNDISTHNNAFIKIHYMNHIIPEIYKDITNQSIHLKIYRFVVNTANRSFSEYDYTLTSGNTSTSITINGYTATAGSSSSSSANMDISINDIILYY